MKKVICSIMVVAILILLIVSCSVKKSNIGISSVAVNETSERVPTTNTQETTSTGQSVIITAEEIIRDHIPKPFNPKVHSNSLEYGGRWKGNVMPGLIQEMIKSGWVELKNEQMGAMLYFRKEVHGQNVRISVLPIEEGGPEEKNATTYITFRIVPDGKM